MSLHRLREPVLVLGATGLVGRHVVSRLAEMRAVATALSRSPPDEVEAAAGVRWIRGDLTAPEDVDFPFAETALSACPIWLLPAVLPRMKAQGLRRLVAFSSTSVSGKARSSDAGERGVAARLAEAEAAVRSFCEANEVAWTILRPTMIYAEGFDGNVSRLAALAQRYKVLPLAGDASGLRQPVHAEDAAWAATAAAASPVAPGRTYDLPGGETLTYKQMVRRIFLGLDRTPRIVCAPEVIWRLAFGLARGRLPGATAAMGERMNQDLVFDGEPAARDFGWAPRPFKPVFPHLERGAA
jgi:nucleoside-diphosphate-sugar epimerase